MLPLVDGVSERNICICNCYQIIIIIGINLILNGVLLKNNLTTQFSGPNGLIQIQSGHNTMICASQFIL